MEVLVDIGRVLYGGVLVILGLNNYLKLEKKIHLAETKGIPFPKGVSYRQPSLRWVDS